MKKVLLTCAAAGLLVGSTVASAAAVCPAPMFHPWYVGVGLKWNATLQQKLTLTTPALPAPIGVVTAEHKLKNNLGWDIFGGYMVSQRFGAELGFVDYGKTKREITSNQVVGTIGTLESNGWLVYFDGMYYMPICKYFKAFVKACVDYIDHKDSVKVGIANIQDPLVRQYDPISGNVGMGIQMDYNQFGARLSYTNYSLFLNSTDLGDWYVPDQLNLDVLYHFG